MGAFSAEADAVEASSRQHHHQPTASTTCGGFLASEVTAQQHVKSADVVGPPPGLSRISTQAAGQAALPRLKLHHHLDVDMSCHCNSPSPTADRDGAEPEDNPMLVDSLIEETVGEMLLGDGLL